MDKDRKKRQNTNESLDGGYSPFLIHSSTRSRNHQEDHAEEAGGGSNSEYAAPEIKAAGCKIRASIFPSCPFEWSPYIVDPAVLDLANDIKDSEQLKYYPMAGHWSLWTPQRRDYSNICSDSHC